MAMMFMTDPQPSGGFRWTQEPWGAALRCQALDDAATHLFTAGNLTLRDDEREWRAVAERMGVHPSRLRLIGQVHEVDVAVVRAGSDGWLPPQADVIVSDDPTSAVVVRVADCAPVLVADRRLGAVGAAHAGWRGTVRRAASVLVAAMARTFGSDPEDLVAAIGPCLGPCCGEMGDEVVDAFRAAGHGDADLGRWFTTGASGRPHFDLWGANRDHLLAAGVPASQICTAELCTKTHRAVLHSYRAHGATAGRMAAVIRARG